MNNYFSRPHPTIRETIAAVILMAMILGTFLLLMLAFLWSTRPEIGVVRALAGSA